MFTGKQDRSQHDNKKTPGNTLPLKPIILTRKVGDGSSIYVMLAHSCRCHRLASMLAWVVFCFMMCMSSLKISIFVFVDELLNLYDL